MDASLEHYSHIYILQHIIINIYKHRTLTSCTLGTTVAINTGARILLPIFGHWWTCTIVLTRIWLTHTLQKIMYEYYQRAVTL